jgi:hypothetical protein
LKDELMTAIPILVLVSIGVVAVVGPAAAEEKWVLWDRPLDSNGRQQGDWRRGPMFDGERWCKGAMTTAINQALTRQAQSQNAPVRTKPTLSEYQCFPESADPRTAKGKR